MVKIGDRKFQRPGSGNPEPGRKIPGIKQPESGIRKARHYALEMPKTLGSWAWVPQDSWVFSILGLGLGSWV